MKAWRPDDGEGSDPMWGGFFSDRGDKIASAVVLVVLLGAWLVFGAAVAGWLLFVAVIVWGWFFR